MSNKKFKNKYRVESARLKNYDYSNNGAYFLTIVTKNRNHFFGEILNEKLLFSEIGKIAQQYWNEIPNQFPFIQLDEMIVMPNHIHGILWIVDVDDSERGNAIDSVRGNAIDSVRRDAINRVSTTVTQSGGITKNHNPMFHDNISRVIRWYKGRCTFEINKIQKNNLNSNFVKFAWQPRFHDRIIRDYNELNRIRNYIKANPKIWYRDRNK